MIMTATSAAIGISATAIGAPWAWFAIAGGIALIVVGLTVLGWLALSVLNVTALGATVTAAQTAAYAAVAQIDWPEGFCRRDIGWREVARERG